MAGRFKHLDRVTSNVARAKLHACVLSLFFLAPLPAIGAIALSDLLATIRSRLSHRKEPNRTRAAGNKKHLSLLLVAIILVSFFVFQVGLIYEIAADVPTSISLSKNRVNNWTSYMNMLYVEQTEVSSTDWLGRQRNVSFTVRSGIMGSLYLNSYGFVPYDRLRVIDQYSTNESITSSYFFFNRENVISKRISGYHKVWNSTDFSSMLETANKIYSNGDTDIYGGPLE